MRSLEFNPFKWCTWTKGTSITTSKTPLRALQDTRVKEAISVADRTCKTKVELDLQAVAISGTAIPKILHGTIWTFPAFSELCELWSSTMAALWGKVHAMRYPEVVLTLLHCTVRVDPVSAIVFRGLLDERRSLPGSMSSCKVQRGLNQRHEQR